MNRSDMLEVQQVYVQAITFIGCFQNFHVIRDQIYDINR